MMIGFWFFAIIFGALFLLGKAVWQDSESFKLWKWKKKLALKNWKERTEYRRNYMIKQLWERLPHLKPLYIITAVIVFIPLVVLFFIFYFQIGSFLLGKETGEIREIAFAFFGTISGLAGLFGVYLAILRSETTERQTRTAEEGLITERINKATEGLGKKDGKEPVIEVRLGALYALERIAQDSFRDHVQIMEILCAYIRTNSPLKSKNTKPKKLREDIQVALTIIGRRDVWSDAEERLDNEQLEGFYIDLSKCDLHRANLDRAEMNRANFGESNLENATFGESNLENVIFNKTNLKNAIFNKTNLQNAEINGAILIDAKLHETNLMEAELEKTNMSGARVYGVDMRGARLYKTNLNGAWITDTNMNFAWIADTDMLGAIINRTYARTGDFSKCKNLAQEQLKHMFFGIDVKIPDTLKRPEHWPKSALLNREFEVAKLKWIQKEFAKGSYKFVPSVYPIQILHHPKNLKDNNP